MKFWFKQKAEIDSQNTGRMAFQHTQGYAFAGINGGAGITAARTIRAMQRATVVPGYSVRPTALSGNGNTLNYNLTTNPLSNPQQI